MSDLKCGCGAAVFERSEYVRRPATGDEVVYYRYRCQGCGGESQEFRPESPPVATATMIVETAYALVEEDRRSPLDTRRAGSRTR